MGGKVWYLKIEFVFHLKNADIERKNVLGLLFQNHTHMQDLLVYGYNEDVRLNYCSGFLYGNDKQIDYDLLLNTN